jgi:DNA topoisomerase-1
MASKWILRKGSKERGFGYAAPNGKILRSRSELDRIDALRIPPAWREVHIAASPRTAIQAWGLDARGRKQYRYHARAVEKGEMRKHYRVREMARDLPRIRSRLNRDFRKRGLSREKVCAGILRLIADGFFRVGSEKYERDNNTFGITTLRKKHVSFDGESAVFEYVGKRSIKQRHVIDSPDLVRFIRQLLKTPGSRLFRYESEGQWIDVDARDVNEYLQSVASFPYTAKDFRTWGGTLRAATVLADLGKGKSANERKKNVVTAVRLVAAELGNTPAICRKSYVHPIIIARYLKSGAIIHPESKSKKSVRESRAPFAHSAEERSLIAFLDEHFPERRSERRDE